MAIAMAAAMTIAMAMAITMAVAIPFTVTKGAIFPNDERYVLSQSLKMQFFHND